MKRNLFNRKAKEVEVKPLGPLSIFVKKKSLTGMKLCPFTNIPSTSACVSTTQLQQRLVT